MNAATRVIRSRSFSERQTYIWQLSRQSVAVFLLMMTLFSSAFAVVYLKDYNRRLFIQYQNLQSDRQSMQLQWGKLLLEQSAWSTQARVQQIAVQKLQMFYPEAKNIVIVD
jgi:cell division protein FtsL